MDKKVRDVLKKIAEKLNKEEIVWGVGASVMLNYYGITEKVNDIDIQVSLDHVDRIDRILAKMGTKNRRLPNDTYKTKYFYEYTIDGVEVDLMGGLCVSRDGKDYSFEFTKNSIGDTLIIEGVEVPLGKLDYWYNIYKVLPGREIKVKGIENYIEKGKLKI